MGVPVAELMTHLPNLKRYARRLTHNDDSADDLVQETVARALRHIDRYQPTGSLQGWLITIMKNQFRETQRRRLLDQALGGRVAVIAMIPVVAGRFDAPQDDHLLLRELGAAIPRLPAVQREVLIAVCLQGLSYEQASARLGIPIGTIRSRLFRARGALQELLEPFAAPGAFRLLAAAARAHARTRH
jgi:RNA polymerase sigma-70 factor (ECF subfamily)